MERMKNIDKELVKAMMNLKEMLDLLKMVDPEELCFEKIRFLSSYHKFHKLQFSNHIAGSSKFPCS